MKKLLFSLATVLFTLPLSVNAEIGGSTQVQEHQQWFSSRLCFTNHCLWRAGTSQNDSIFAVDYLDNEKIRITYYSYDVSDQSLESWTTDSDQVKIDFRVDRLTLYTLNINRYLNRSERTIYYDIPSNELGQKFINELKKGNTLRLRTHLNGNTYVVKFSLSGASAAIKRADTNSLKVTETKKKDNSYFEENDNDFFESTETKI